MQDKTPKKVTFFKQVSYNNGTNGALKSLNQTEEIDERFRSAEAISRVAYPTTNNYDLGIRFSEPNIIILPALSMDLRVGDDYTSPYGHPQLAGQGSSCYIIS